MAECFIYTTINTNADKIRAMSDEELAARPQQPLTRDRQVSKALRAYAQSVSSADKGGVRII